MNPLRRLIVLVSAISCALAIVVLPAMAQAKAGSVTGQFKLLNHNGHFCPSTSACTGATYTQSQLNTYMPVANAKVYVYGDTGLIGQGSTNDNGNYTVSWVGPVDLWEAQVCWVPAHKDGRFRIGYSNGALPYYCTDWRTLATGATNFGTFNFGTATSPDPYANSYWAAEWEWRLSFNYVGVLQTNLWGVDVRGFGDNIFTSCGVGCASGTGNWIQLGTNTGFMPESRMMHELGHIANYAARHGKDTTNTCWPSVDTGGCGWGYTRPPRENDPTHSQNQQGEWAHLAFDEAIADFAGETTIWWPNALTPSTCIGSEAQSCPNGQPNLEFSSSPPGYNWCSNGIFDGRSYGPESRWPITYMRFLWDLYDEHDEGGDTIQWGWSYWQFWGALTQYTEGTQYYDNNSAWDSTLTRIPAEKADNHGVNPYVYYWWSTFGVNAWEAQNLNCSPL